jgi:hypothetical protein
MNEYIIALHMHTRYSDGSGSHGDLANAALKTGVDVLLVTDHNVLVQGFDRYFEKDGRRVLMLVGEEIHDQARQPQKNHLLAFGITRELATYARDPQTLINQVRDHGGLAFIAHPVDPELPLFGETDISWVDWSVDGYTGIELWNGFSELKYVLKSKLQAVFYAFFPQFYAHGPLPEAVARWDNLMASGKRVVAVGGADAHALRMSMGPLHRTIFPYEYHFSAVTTHIQTNAILSGEVDVDRKLILSTLAQGHAFVAYDLPAPARGFNFTAQTESTTAMMGDELPFAQGIKLGIHLPRACDCRLLLDGVVVKRWQRGVDHTYDVTQPGVYRVECWLNYLGKKRAWIFSNPIYLR